MPFLGNKLCTSSPFFFRTPSFKSSDSSMGSSHSTQKASKRSRPSSTYLPSYSLNAASLASNNGNSNKLDDPWGPPPYTAEPTQPFSPETIQAVSSAQSSNTRSAGDSEYAFLTNFDTIFLVDDSGSMAGRSWKEAEEAIAMITPICTQYDTDGIDLYFLNHKNPATQYQGTGYKNIASPAAVQDIFRRVRPYGMTPVGQRLQEILVPYMKRVGRMVANMDDYGQLKNPELAVRPMNIIVITDGVFSDDAESVILNAARTLDQYQTIPWQVGIQFFQIGSDREASKYLEKLDDDLCKAVADYHVRDIVDTVPWKGQTGRTLSGDGILKVVLGAVNKRLDRQKGH